MTVNSDGTLSGTGKITASVVTVGGTLSPGNSPGTIDITGNLSFNSTGKFNYEVDSSVDPAVGADLVTVTGNLSINPAATLIATDTPNLVLPPGTKFTLISYAGTWDNGTFDTHPDDSLITIGANQFVLNYNDITRGVNFGGGPASQRYVTLTMVAVPEASTVLFGTLLCGVLGLVYGGNKKLARAAAARAFDPGI